MGYVNLPQIGYVAGLVDGEGSILLTKLNNNCYRSPVVSIASTTLEILKFCKDYYGGSISIKKKYQEHHKQSYVWSITHNSAIRCLEDICDYLLVPEKVWKANKIISEFRDVTIRNGKYNEKAQKAKERFEFEFMNMIGFN